MEEDNEYIGEVPQKVKFPGCASNPTKNQAMKNQVRSRQETINRRLKNLAILNVMCCHYLMEHGIFFWVIVVITQIGINGGERLFEVDYSDV